ncbi:HD domain-containing protein [Lentilactobacillus kisonensis]|uniref:HD domain protein n=2 Tax=Lentilactobacillus kisonensis TaxID=481722 RepID=H1LC60_9LACO|nr:HD domain-containing protein [Lentilactobacillus kisonensis]EHO54281.1 HD domain protein [Lentilactobacillus kisonensis F0435]KRL20739.1 HD domain protein [Lentilactobacillus kisonensis DSM 19906 = JCM 15041]
MIEGLRQIREFVEQQLEYETTGHDYTHIERVVKLAKLILKGEEADERLVLIAAYLHDVSDDKVTTNPEEKRKAITNKLKEIGSDDLFIKNVFEIIDNMSYSANLKTHHKLSIEGQIVQDADRLDAIGAIGIARTFYFGGHFGEMMYNPKIMPRKDMNKAEYRKRGTVINHFYEKLLKLKDQMNTETAKKIANHRQQVMLEFLSEFTDEWNGLK